VYISLLFYNTFVNRGMPNNGLHAYDLRFLDFLVYTRKG
jgi:hypothetical protein